MLTPLVILGAGGHARDILDLIDAINEIAPRFDPLGFIVDAAYGSAGDLVNDKPILGDFSWLERYPHVLAIGGVGLPALRRKMVQHAVRAGVNFAKLIHPTAQLARGVTIGAGSVIFCRATLSNQCQIGEHVHVHVHCTVGHNTILEDYVSLSPGTHVTGSVHIRQGAEIGTGSNIIPRITVGAWSIVGAGTTLIRDVPADSTVVGVPGRVIRNRPAGWHFMLGGLT